MSMNHVHDMDAANSIADSEEVEDALYPIAILLDELKSDNIALRLNATAHIKTIAKVLGPERTRSELIPFLTDTVDDEDEVLMTLAAELGDFIEEIGGVAHAGVLCEALEALSAIEETMVREKAVDSLKRISEATLSASDDGKDFHVNYMHPLVKRLATGDWFTIRISACALLAPLYSRLPRECGNLKSDCLVMYKSLAEDETPMVRRAATCSVGQMAKAVAETDPYLVEKEVFPIFKQLAKDEQDSVRLLIVEMSTDIAMLLPKPKVNGDVDMTGARVSPLIDEEMVPIAKNCGGDSSWRVRYMIADKLPALCTAFGPHATWTELLPLYIRLLRDAEPEVRTAAAYKMSEFTERIAAIPEGQIPKTPNGEKVTAMEMIVEHIIPVLKDLVNDPSQHVRAALASNIMGMVPILNKPPTLQEILDFILALLKDEVPDVRLNVIAHLDSISSVLGSERLTNELLPSIMDLAQDRNWRVRSAVIRHIPSLAKKLGKDKFVVDHALGALCVNWLKDTVYAIRKEAIENLRQLTKLFGVNWAKEHIVPQILDIFKHSTNYVFRISALMAMGILAEELGAAEFEESFLGTLTDDACKDPVPNVRFTAAKTLEKTMAMVGESARMSKIRPCLVEMEKSENDDDVKFFATQALDTLSACG